ncbi:hypothetical protein ES319_A06G128700v1 [Gossypium barbadense]|uniref:Uncharacterized protein n=2 Tax=Gossypium TaxID=3633 RepID=A0A5J5VDM9_GOSBA|nr:hypothetical protein ES319_A06G128700v1 [Gossypium barbadense]TYH13507.1 hypothetical protein ES288_A06G143800v1 [Gossypium darwinii]
MVFFARYGRTKEMTRMAWRPCAGISCGKPTLCCPSSVFQELLEFLATEILFSFGFFWVWARFRISVYEFGLKLYLGWYKLFIWA